MEENILKKFEEFLQKRHYKEKTILIYLRQVGPLIKQIIWQTPEDFCEQISTMVECNNPVNHSLRAGLHQFFLMQTGQEVKEFKKKQTQMDGKLNQLLMNLSKYLRNVRGYQNSSTGKCVSVAKMFIETFTKDGVFPDWSEIDALKLRDYLNLRSKSISVSSLGVEATNIRTFFKFLEYSGIKINQSVFNLRITFPKSKKLVPRIFTKTELAKAVGFYSATTEKDVRNKLIVLLMVQLGLRTSEISSIQLEDIHWRAGTLTIKSSKTKTEILNVLCFKVTFGHFTNTIEVPASLQRVWFRQFARRCRLRTDFPDLRSNLNNESSIIASPLSLHVLENCANMNVFQTDNSSSHHRLNFYSPPSQDSQIEGFFNDKSIGILKPADFVHNSRIYRGGHNNGSR